MRLQQGAARRSREHSDLICVRLPHLPCVREPSARQQAPFARESWRPSSSMPTAPRTNDQAVYRDGCEWFQAAGFCGLVSTCRGTL